MYIPLEEITIAKAIKSAGYATISTGKWPVGNEKKYYPIQQGFDSTIAGCKHGCPLAYLYPYKDPERDWNPDIPTLKGGKAGDYLIDRFTDEAIQFMENTKDVPFFLFLPSHAVHTSLQAPENLIEKYRKRLMVNTPQKKCYLRGNGRTFG